MNTRQPRRCRRELDAALDSRGQTIEDAIRSEARHQAAEQAFMANLIGSLRLVSSFDWSEFFESVSLVEQILNAIRPPSTGAWISSSRDRYRHAVEETGRTDAATARCAWR